MRIKELQESVGDHSRLIKIRADRAAAQHTAKLVSIKKDGTESKMHDAAKTFPTESEARAYHAKIVKLNPGRNIRHNLYVDGKLMHMLDVNSLTEDASPGATASGNVASLAMPLGAIQRRPNMFGDVPSGKTIRKKRKS